MKALKTTSRVSFGLLRSTLLVLGFILMGFNASAHSMDTGGKKTKAQKKEARLAKKAAREEARRLREMAMLGDADYLEEESSTRSRTERSRIRPTESGIEHPPSESVPTSKASGPSMNSMEEYALSLQGTPYRYGGTDKKGFDCSGYVQHVFNKEGVFVPRTAQAQFETCDMISERHAEKGDLVFFGKSKRHIDHVGILISESGTPLSIIHSSSSQGIVITNIEESNYWKPKMVGFGRVKRD
jgi:cell wall-associated NlpC family hydrolase